MRLESKELFSLLGIEERTMSYPLEAPIVCEQIYSRKTMGYLWNMRSELDGTQVTYLDSLFKGKRKGVIRCSFTSEYKLPNTPIGRLGYGRIYGHRGSMERLEKEIRGTLCKEFYHDIDVVNCHPVLLVQFAKRYYNIDLSEVATYCENREDFLTKISDNRDEAKTEVIRIMYGGANKHPILEPFHREVSLFTMRVMSDEKYSDLLREVAKIGGNVSGSFLSHVLQTEERRVMMAMYKAFTEMGRSVDVLAYDGTQVRQEQGKVITSDMLREVEGVITKETEYVVQLLEKPFQSLDIPESESKYRLIKTDKEAVDLLFPELKETIVYSKGVHYYKVGLSWTSSTSVIDSHLRQFLMEANLWKRGVDEDKPYSTEFTNSSHLTTLIKERAIQECDDEWIVGVGIRNKGKILYKNGYYDMSHGVFLTPDNPLYDSSIVFMETVPYDWTPEMLDSTYQASILKRFFLLQHDEVKGKYLALVQARGIAGDAMKHFVIGTGSGNTGKSFLAKTMGVVFGGYVGTFNGANLIYKPSCSQDEAQRNRWIGLLQNKRVIFSSELRMDKNALDGNMMKTLSSGGHDPVVARGHAQDEREIPWRGLCFLLANDMGRIHPVDEPLMKRILYFSYDKQYVDEDDEKKLNPYQLKIDRDLEKEIMTPRFKMNYAYLLFQAYHSWVMDGEKEIVPEEVRAGSKELVGETCPVKRFLDYGFVITDNAKDSVTSSSIQRWIDEEKVGISMTKFGREMNKYVQLKGYKNVESKQMKIAGKGVKCWVGIKEDTSTTD